MANTLKWQLGTSEIGKACGKNTDGVMKVYVAKLLPLVAFGKPKEKQVALTKACYINAKECKPSIASKVTTVNYLDIPIAKTSELKPEKIKHGTTLRIDIKNQSVEFMTVVSKKDKNS